jgi:hypothetical protein
MDRQIVYFAIDSERDYQDRMTASDDRPDMVEIGLGETLLAMEHALAEARTAWYYGHAPHPDAMNFVRKVAGLAVKAGEMFGMPER